MARMHSRKKGKSGSTKPDQKKAPAWTKYKAKEVEMLVAKLAKEGHPSSVIGVILRDSYGIPDTKIATKKSITKIMDEKELTPKLPEDLQALIKKSVAIRKHREENRQDKTSLRGLQLTESKIKRLVKYYKASGKLDASWKYDPNNVKLYLE